jgi:caa(3)-type oxidase subunit IV
MRQTDRHGGAGGGRYLVALAVLLALTGLSFGLASAGLGAAGPAVAFGIAGIKVVVVAVVFMHLREAAFATRMVGVVIALFIAFLCLGVVADVAFR